MGAVFEPLIYLQSLASMEDEEIDLAKAALALSALQHEGASLGAYIHHLERLAEDVAQCYQAFMVEGREESAALRLEALTDVLAEDYGYIGDLQNYDDLQNASLIRVIDRAMGLPIALSILYIHAGRAQGWDIEGLGLPGHFVCRLNMGAEQLIFDPFHGGQVVGAPELRKLVKQVLGPDAELSSSYYEAVTKRDILIRLENNIKSRKIDLEDYEGALEHVERMRLIDPGEYRLLLDAGVLYAKVGMAKAAIEALSSYIDAAPYDRDRHEAALLLTELLQSLN